MLLICLTRRPQKWTRHPRRKITGIKRWCLTVLLASFLLWPGNSYEFLGESHRNQTDFTRWVLKPSTHDLKYHSESIKRRILYLDVVKLVKWYQCSHRFIWQVCTRESHALNLQWKFHIVFFARGISILGSWTGCDTEENLWIKFSPLSIRHLQASGVPVAAHSPHLLLGV